MQVYLRKPSSNAAKGATFESLLGRNSLHKSRSGLKSLTQSASTVRDDAPPSKPRKPSVSIASESGLRLPQSLAELRLGPDETRAKQGQTGFLFDSLPPAEQSTPARASLSKLTCKEQSSPFIPQSHSAVSMQHRRSQSKPREDSLPVRQSRPKRLQSIDHDPRRLAEANRKAERYFFMKTAEGKSRRRELDQIKIKRLQRDIDDRRLRDAEEAKMRGFMGEADEAHSLMISSFHKIFSPRPKIDWVSNALYRAPHFAGSEHPRLGEDRLSRELAPPSRLSQAEARKAFPKQMVFQAQHSSSLCSAVIAEHRQPQTASQPIVVRARR